MGDVDTKRHWLRPVVYVTNIGDGLVSEGPWLGGCRLVPDDEPDPWCVRCGKPDLETYFHQDSSAVCEDCYVRPPPLTGWARLTNRVSAKLDNLYFAYAIRFGKRQPNPYG